MLLDRVPRSRGGSGHLLRLLIMWSGSGRASLPLTVYTGTFPVESFMREEVLVSQAAWWLGKRYVRAVTVMARGSARYGLCVSRLAAKVAGAGLCPGGGVETKNSQKFAMFWKFKWGTGSTRQGRVGATGPCRSRLHQTSARAAYRYRAAACTQPALRIGILESASASHTPFSIAPTIHSVHHTP